MTVAEFDIAGAPLDKTLAVAATNHKTVEAWRRGENRIDFLWSTNAKDAVPLPGPTKVEDCEGFIRSALSTMDYGAEPDCDGSVSKSWRVRHRLPGDAYDSYLAFVVTPHWNEYHK